MSAHHHVSALVPIFWARGSRLLGRAGSGHESQADGAVTMESIAMEEARKRLEELRAGLRAERISLGELIELEGLAEYIEPGDVELLEAAGVPEHPEEGEFVAVDLTENNRHQYPDTPNLDLGWGVCRHGHGLQHFGDGYMTETVARERARVLNAGGIATDVPNREEE